MANKVTNIKERVLYLTDFKGITKEVFFKEIGMSYGSFKGKAKDKALNSDAVATIITKYPEINAEWLLTGNGNIEKDTIVTNAKEEIKKKAIQRQTEIREKGIEYKILPSLTDRVENNQMIPLYDLEAVAGVIPLISDITNQTPIDHVYIPNAPKCDGAMYATGDSMYPLLKSGDILAFKIIKDFLNDVFFGEMYILFIEIAGDLFRTVKFIHKGSDNEHFKLVSQNKHHQDKDIHISKIKALAQVKASIRMH